MGAAVPMVQLMGRRLSIPEQESTLALLDKIAARGGKLTPREAEIRRTLRKVQYNRKYSAAAYRPKRTRRAAPMTLAAVVNELTALQAIERARGLSPDESERLGVLVLIEQRRARTRPARIAKLRAELELLESLEIAEHGAGKLATIEAPAVEMVCGASGTWSTSGREAA
jgi:hypothetical protein